MDVGVIGGAVTAAVQVSAEPGKAELLARSHPAWLRRFDLRAVSRDGW